MLIPKLKSASVKYFFGVVFIWRKAVLLLTRSDWHSVTFSTGFESERFIVPSRFLRPWSSYYIVPPLTFYTITRDGVGRVVRLRILALDE